MVTTAQYKSGEIIIRENDQGETAYVIESGRVEVTKYLQGKNIHLTYLYPGETFGEMSMIDDKPRSATVTAADDTEVRVIPRDQFLETLKSNPEVALKLLKTVFKRLRETSAMIAQLQEIRMSTSNNKSTDEAEIRDLVESWARAVRTKNLDGILANHSPEILMFDVPPPAQSKGIDAYKKTWDVFFAWFQDSGVFDIKELNITAGEDVAFGTALMRCAGTEASGDKIELDFRLTIGLRKIGGQWIVMHEHHSIPAS